MQAGIDSESIFIDILWIDESYRKQGLGTTLLLAAEQEAKRFGCKYSTLDTIDYQAVDFYLKNHYQCIGEIKNYTFGHSKIFFRKDLK